MKKYKFSFIFFIVVLCFLLVSIILYRKSSFRNSKDYLYDDLSSIDYSDNDYEEDIDSADSDSDYEEDIDSADSDSDYEEDVNSGDSDIDDRYDEDMIEEDMIEEDDIDGEYPVPFDQD